MLFLLIFDTARAKNISPKKPPHDARIARGLKCLATPVKENAPTPRKKSADVRTPDRWKIVTAFFELLEGQDRLPRGAMETLNSLVTHLNLTSRTIQRIVERSIKSRKSSNQQTYV